MPLKKDIKVKTVTSDAEFAQLRARWNSLADASQTGTVFLRHEWFDAAWQWLKNEHELLILSVTRAGESIGLWPLVRRRKKQRKIGVCAIEFMAIPDTQVCDAICLPDDHETVVEALMDYLGTNRRMWDICELEKLPADSPTVELLGLDRGASATVFDIQLDGSNPQIDLSRTWPEFYATRSRRLKKGNNLVANRLKKKFDDIELRWIRARDVDESSVSEALRTTIEVSSRSWKNETGMSLDNVGPGAFIDKLTSHALEQNWLSLWILELDGRAAAVEYQLSYLGDIHALRGDFDNELSQLSPGTFMNWKILERLFDDDQECYHMGPGDNNYKLRWAENAPALCRATAYGRSARGRLLSMVERSLRPLVVAVAERAKSRLSRKD